ncbi:MAG: hypothetical protein ACU4EQ_03995 [Candidatus Nitrosoglobus sp.]
MAEVKSRTKNTEAANYHSTDIRIKHADSKVWLCARDLARAWGCDEYYLGNILTVLKRMPDRWKRKFHLDGCGDTWFLSEAGTYYFLSRTLTGTSARLFEWIIGVFRENTAENARDKIWQLEGYLLQERLSHENSTWSIVMMSCMTFSYLRFSI